MAFAISGCVSLASLFFPGDPGPRHLPQSERTTGANADNSTTGMIATPGGVWTRPIAADPVTLNPLLSMDPVSHAIQAMLLPTLFAVDPFSGALVSGKRDGQTVGCLCRWPGMDLYLRDGVVWSDGDPVDAADFEFTFAAIASDQVTTALKQRLNNVQEIEVVDPLTVVVTFGEVKCDALMDLAGRWLPSHLFAADFSDLAQNSFNTAPTVSAGPFRFQSWTPGEQIVLTRNDLYWGGPVGMDSMVFKIVADPLAQWQQLQSGVLDVAELSPQQAMVEKGDTELALRRLPGDGYSFIAFNLADPKNPQPGQDGAGLRIEQAPHPILAERVVRLAIAHSLDSQTIIDEVYAGQGVPLSANVLPGITWAFDPSLAPYPSDINLARRLLDDAGWVFVDNDGVRERAGQDLRLTLITNTDNAARAKLARQVRRQLDRVGFDIKLETLDFNSLSERLFDQTFDMAILGWSGLGADPGGDISLWHSRFDRPGSGYNFVSYQDAVVDQLLDAGNAMPGCAPSDRLPVYRQIQRIIYDDLPYIFLVGDVVDIGISASWQGLNPGPWDFYHNVHDWVDEAWQEDEEASPTE